MHTQEWMRRDLDKNSFESRDWAYNLGVRAYDSREFA
jgi:hypothetical protein